MPSCRNCGEDVEDDWHYCMSCGCSLWLWRNFRLEWSPSVAESNNIHWLAQAQRRLVLPIESTEEVPFLAFEYAWKVINGLYNSVPVPKILVSESGKTREATAKESVLYLLRHFDVTREVLEVNRELIQTLCDCVLETPDPAYFGDRRGSVTFADVSPGELTELRENATEKCKKLATAVAADNYNEAAEALVENSGQRSKRACTRGLAKAGQIAGWRRAA